MPGGDHDRRCRASLPRGLARRRPRRSAGLSVRAARDVADGRCRVCSSRWDGWTATSWSEASSCGPFAEEVLFRGFFSGGCISLPLAAEQGNRCQCRAVPWRTRHAWTRRVMSDPGRRRLDARVDLLRWNSLWPSVGLHSFINLWWVLLDSRTDDERGLHQNRSSAFGPHRGSSRSGGRGEMLAGSQFPPGPAGITSFQVASATATTLPPGLAEHLIRSKARHDMIAHRDV